MKLSWIMKKIISSYIITIYFDDKTSAEYVHLGNKYFKELWDKWYEMTYEKAERLDDIYSSLDRK